MTMEDEMTKKELYDMHVYVEGRYQPLPVDMYTDEHSEVCSIRFGKSFTLNVVTPLDLLMLAREIETFAKRAHELHYGEEPTGFRRPVGEAMADIQKKLDAWVEACKEEYDPEDTDPVRIMAEEAQWKDPNDPVNW